MLKKISEFFGKEKRGYKLEWIPVMCARLSKDEISMEELTAFIGSARQELHNEMETFYRNCKIMSGMCLTPEEKRALEIAESLKDKELVRYYKALKCLEKYAKNGKKTKIVEARRFYEESELSWQKLLEHMMQLVMINLGGKRFIPVG